jgi:hypothetical protein
LPWPGELVEGLQRKAEGGCSFGEFSEQHIADGFLLMLAGLLGEIDKGGDLKEAHLLHDMAQGLL